MFKKSILPVVLLAMVVVLSVFYIKQSQDEIIDPVSGDNPQTVLVVLASKRLEILEQRSNTIDELEALIASGSLSDEEIEKNVNQINDLYYLKYTETHLEELIEQLGYEDSLVIIDDKNVSVMILSDELATSDFISVARVVKEQLNSDYKVSLELVEE